MLRRIESDWLIKISTAITYDGLTCALAHDRPELHDLISSTILVPLLNVYRLDILPTTKLTGVKELEV